MDRAGVMREPGGRRAGMAVLLATITASVIMQTALPNDVLIVEDDPIIALHFEDAIIGFGVKSVRCAGSVAL